MSKKLEMSPSFPNTYVSRKTEEDDEYPNGLYMTREKSTISANMTRGNEAANFLADNLAESSMYDPALGGMHVSLMFDVSDVSMALIICLNLGKPVNVTFFSAIPL